MSGLLEQIKQSIISINKDECHYSKNLKELTEKPLDTSVIIEILNNGYMNHKDMEALNCMLESYLRKNRVIDNINLIISEEIDDIASTNNLNTLKNGINTYIKNIRPLSSNSGANSEVYFADLFVNDIPLVIKFPQEDDRMEKIDFMKEYILGKSINKLRQITPSFMYTFSLFGCGLESSTKKICTTKESLPLLILEKVNGKSMAKFILKPNTTFEEWLKIYVQVLLNLEIAQKLYKFNHNDLHQENVMISKEKQPITYSFNSETKTYKVTTDTFPVLIDFGYSGMDVYGKHVKGINIGQAFPPEFTTCYDMYLHLGRCIYFFSEKYAKRIGSNVGITDPKIITIPEMKKLYGLYEFFEDDPYNIYNNPSNLFKNSDFFEKVNYKKTLRRTPGEFLEWIMDRYGNVLSNVVTVSKRKTYINPMPNQYDMYNNFYVSKYHEIIPLKTNSKVITKIIKKFTTCTTKQDHQSYITSIQSIKILESMTNNSTNAIVKNAKKVFTDMISEKKRKNTLIATDLVRLNTFFTNKNFDFIKDDDFDKDKLGNTFDSFHKIKLDMTIINQINDMIVFVKHIKPYYNVYLMIKELKMTEYNDWISKFENSDIFKYYEKFADKIDRYNRYMFAVLQLNITGRF